MDTYLIIDFIVRIIVFLFIVIGCIVSFKMHNKKLNKRHEELVAKQKVFIKKITSDSGVTLKEWTEITNSLAEIGTEDFPGIAIFHNVTDDKYYIGQSLLIVDFVHIALDGNSNKDLYVDTKYKDMTIQVVSMSKDYETLNDLEEEYVARYDAIKI